MPEHWCAMAPKRRRFRPFRWLLGLLFLLFAAVNTLAAFHAWKFTHYDPELTGDVRADEFTARQKLRAALTGVSLPRPVNTSFPSADYEDVFLDVPTGQMHAWWVPVKDSRGTVVLFHGYGASAGSVLDRGGAFRRMGFSTLLVDFTGSGESSGTATTIGWTEAAEVRAAADWASKKSGGNPVHLFGVSLGAAAVLKAVHEGARPASVILECPFGTLLQAVKNRCVIARIPPEPTAQLVTFWGGALHGFNAFRHNPQDYARSVQCPTLLLWGDRDDRVIRAETDAVFSALGGTKKLVVIPGAGHENLLAADRDRWTAAISAHLGVGEE